ncbi:MAG TPA: hypothetical protein VFW22_05095 [Pseudolabrys sp.]|nr:hypothetical protein [Pseudolabrys sp.]
MTLKTILAAGAILLSATTVSLAQSQPNCGPNAPSGDTFGTVPTGTLGAQRGAARCQAHNAHAYRHHRHYRHRDYSER